MVRQNWPNAEVVEIRFLTIIPSPGLYSFMMTWLGALWTDSSNAPVADRRSIMFGLKQLFVMILLSEIFRWIPLTMRLGTVEEAGRGVCFPVQYDRLPKH